MAVLKRCGQPTPVRAEAELDGRVVRRAGEMLQGVPIRRGKNREPAVWHCRHITIQVAREIDLRVVMLHGHRPPGADPQVGQRECAGGFRPQFNQS